MKKIIIYTVAIIAMSFAASSNLPAQQVVPTDLPALMSAQVAFYGKCIAAEPKTVENPKSHLPMDVTAYRFSIADGGMLKGDAADEFEFLQWGKKRVSDGTIQGRSPVDMPTYEVGKEYLLFLTSESPIGLRTTVGLGYGKFDVVTARDGKKSVMNRYKNKDLLKSEDPKLAKAISTSKNGKSLKREGALGLEEFSGLVRDMAKEAK